MNSKKYETNGYEHDLNLLINSHLMHEPSAHVLSSAKLNLFLRTYPLGAHFALNFKRFSEGVDSSMET